MKKHDKLLCYFNRHNEDYQKLVGHSRSNKSYHRYLVVCKHLRNFILTAYQREDMAIDRVSLQTILAFEQYLRVDRGLRNNTVWVYMIAFKHILKLARAEGFIPTDPFASYTNRFQQVDRGYLTEEELQRILLFQTDNPMQAHVRDLFVFSVFTGLSYADVKALRWDNVRTLFDGQTWIVTRRRKTNTPSNLLLLDIPRQIMVRSGSREAEHVFNVPSNSCCNDHLIDMGHRCGIVTHLTFHIARHTFATLSLSKGVPIETLSSILGHTNIRTTQIYAKITNKKISEDMTAFAEKIKDWKV
jgi:integrase